MKKLYPAAAILFLIVAVWFGWKNYSASHQEVVTFYAMDTPMTITAYGPKAKAGISAARARIKEIERELSVTDPESVVARLNAAGGKNFEVTDDVASLTDFALKMNAETDGAFDPTLYPILRAWGFTTDERRVPSSAEIDELKKLTGADKIFTDGKTVRLAKGSMVDFGALGKGLAADEAAKSLRGAGVTSAVLNLGGDVRTVGSRTGGPWRIGVRAPGGGLLGVLETGEAAIVTSGGYERFFKGPDGQIYWHILDPATGCPARSGVVSSTVAGESGTMCDALSTAFFVMGADKTADYWRAHEGFEFILLTDEGEIFLSDGAAKKFSVDSEFKDAKVTVIRR